MSIALELATLPWLLLTSTMMSGYLHGASLAEIGKLVAVFFRTLQYSYLFGILPSLMFGAIDCSPMISV